MILIEKYIPKVIEKLPEHHRAVYVEMLLQLKICATCNKVMLPIGTEGHKDPFPHYYAINAAAQARSADWRFESDFFFDDERICTNCATAGRSRYTCYMCKAIKLSGTEAYVVGSETLLGTDRICTTCFETRTAKDYHEAVSELETVHAYDYE